MFFMAEWNKKSVNMNDDILYRESMLFIFLNLYVHRFHYNYRYKSLHFPSLIGDGLHGTESKYIVVVIIMVNYGRILARSPQI
jgi:hypothetical protein